MCYSFYHRIYHLKKSPPPPPPPKDKMICAEIYMLNVIAGTCTLCVYSRVGWAKSARKKKWDAPVGGIVLNIECETCAVFANIDNAQTKDKNFLLSTCMSNSAFFRILCTCVFSCINAEESRIWLLESRKFWTLAQTQSQDIQVQNISDDKSCKMMKFFKALNDISPKHFKQWVVR